MRSELQRSSARNQVQKFAARKFHDDLPLLSAPEFTQAIA
jgi:hypothetical protein